MVLNKRARTPGLRGGPTQRLPSVVLFLDTNGASAPASRSQSKEKDQRCWILAVRRGEVSSLCLHTSGFQGHLELLSPLNMLCCATLGRSLTLSGDFEAYPRSPCAIIKQQISESEDLGLSSDSARLPWVTLGELSKFYESLLFLL